MDSDQYLLIEDDRRPSRCVRCLASVKPRTIRLVFIIVVIVGCIIAVIVLNNHFKAKRGPAVQLCESWVRDYMIVPDVVQNCPASILDIQYYVPSTNQSIDIQYASEISPANLTSPNLPVMSSEIFQSDRRYMLWIVDPDFPTSLNATMRSRVYAYYTEVIGTNPLSFNQSVETMVYPYTPIKPPFATGPHRYVFLVYDTTGLPYKMPNTTFPVVGMQVDSFMSYIFNTDMTGNIVAGNFFKSECRDVSCI